MIDVDRRTQYFVVNVAGALLDGLRSRDAAARNALAESVLKPLSQNVAPERLRLYLPATNRGLPSARLMLSYTFPDAPSMVETRNNVEKHLCSVPQPGPMAVLDAPLIVNAGADPLAQFAHGVETLFPVHGTRSLARQIMRADVLATNDNLGQGVNVAIVDQGLDREALVARYTENVWGGRLDFVGDWPPDQDDASQVQRATRPHAKSHGLMIARNVLDLAPRAKLWDVPIIPDQIGDPAFFASRVHAILEDLLQEILARKRKGIDERWVVVNAWAVYDRSREWPPGDYSQNRHEELYVKLTDAQRKELNYKPGHPLINTVGDLVDAGADVVFCAGNCGQFSASPRCSASDRGQGRSIWGANAHPHVVTVGAVSVAANWLGYSSEGPAVWINGNRHTRIEKPDIVAPSHFAEDDDAAHLNTGTSAATALVAGAIAALRSRGSRCRDLPPAVLRSRLIETARGGAGGWDPRTGHGIIDLAPFCAVS